MASIAARRGRALTVLLALVTLVVASCSSSPAAQKKKEQQQQTEQASQTQAPESSSESQPTSGKAATDITIGIDVPFHPIWDYVEAKASTYFANKPYKVHFKVLDATTQVPAFGKDDLQVMTTVPSFMPRVQEQYGIQTTYFFPLARWTVGPQILVKKGSPYKTLADLKGKKVAMPPFSERFGAEQAAILAATGEKIQDYFKLQQTDAAAQQLTLGHVDAAFIEAPSTFPLLNSGKFKAIYSVHDAFLKAFGDPGVLNGGYIARTSFVKDNPQFIKDLIAATQDAWNKYQADPDAVNKVASKVSGIAVDQLAVVGKTLDLLKMPEKERAVLPQDVATWQKLYPILQKAGFIKKAPAAANVPSMFQVTRN